MNQLVMMAIDSSSRVGTGTAKQQEADEEPADEAVEIPDGMQEVPAEDSADMAAAEADDPADFQEDFQEGFQEDSQEAEAGPERQTYRGFLLIRCGCCGKVSGYRTQGATSVHKCRECGGETELRDLKMLYLNCQECDKEWKYKTNLTDEEYTYFCLGCGREVTLRLNRRGDTYVTKRPKIQPSRKLRGGYDYGGMMRYR